MKIQIVLNSEKYIQSYADVGGLENSINIVAPDDIVVKENVIHGENIGIKESLSQEFKENYMFYKFSENRIFFDKK